MSTYKEESSFTANDVKALQEKTKSFEQEIENLSKLISTYKEESLGTSNDVKILQEKSQSLEQEVGKFNVFITTFNEESSNTLNRIKMLEEKNKNLEDELAKTKQQNARMQSTQNFLILLSIASLIIALIAIFK